MLTDDNSRFMKNIRSFLLSLTFISATIISCSNEGSQPHDTGAQALLLNSTFLVHGFEVYNHDQRTNEELTLACDSMYITFVDNKMYTTKVFNDLNDPEQTEYLSTVMDVHYANGAFLGIWPNPSTYREVVGFGSNTGIIGFELSGPDCNSGEFISEFISMSKMERHPKAAREISGLPG